MSKKLRNILLGMIGVVICVGIGINGSIYYISKTTPSTPQKKANIIKEEPKKEEIPNEQPKKQTPKNTPVQSEETPNQSPMNTPNQPIYYHGVKVDNSNSSYIRVLNCVTGVMYSIEKTGDLHGGGDLPFKQFISALDSGYLNTINIKENGVPRDMIDTFSDYCDCLENTKKEAIWVDNGQIDHYGSLESDMDGLVELSKAIVTEGVQDGYSPQR